MPLDAIYKTIVIGKGCSLQKDIGDFHCLATSAETVSLPVPDYLLCVHTSSGHTHHNCEVSYN